MLELFSLAAERVASYHLDIVYADLCTAIESDLSARHFVKARNKLFKLFQMIAEGGAGEEVGGTDVSELDESHYVFWNHKVTRLMLESPDIAFQLAWECVDAMEDRALKKTEKFDENLQICVYSLANATTHKLLSLSPDKLNQHIALTKCVMRRSSEFNDQERGGRVFDNAAEEFLRCMELVPPSERYDHVFELYLWLGERKHPSDLLQEFVNDMMGVAEEYENGIKYIPDVLPQHEERPTYLTLVYSRAPE